MTLLLLIVAITLAVLLVALLVWIARLLAASDVPQDIAGRSSSSPRGPGWFGRLRLWLTATPKRLDYRRDKKGRFRRVRRG